MNKQVAWTAAGGVALALIVGGGVALLSGGGDDTTAVDASATTTTTQVSSGGSGQGGAPPGRPQGGSGQGGSGQSPTTQPGNGNQAPYIRDLTGDTDNTDEQGNKVPVGLIDGHAIDPDGPSDQEVDHVTIDWGDGEKTLATRGGNNAFSAQHPYDKSSYSGQTVTVKVTAFDAQGASASQNVTLHLPTV